MVAASCRLRTQEASMTVRTAFGAGGVLVVSLLVPLGIVAMPSSVAAQAAVGALVGNVTDESGGAVPGATIMATEVRTNVGRTAVSNAAGNYSFTNLASGLYRVEGELVGF